MQSSGASPRSSYVFTLIAQSTTSSARHTRTSPSHLRPLRHSCAPPRVSRRAQHEPRLRLRRSWADRRATPGGAQCAGATRLRAIWRLELCRLERSARLWDLTPALHRAALANRTAVPSAGEEPVQAAASADGDKAARWGVGLPGLDSRPCPCIAVKDAALITSPARDRAAALADRAGVLATSADGGKAAC